MRKHMLRHIVLPVVSALSLTAPGVHAQGSDRATILILDASGSMWGKLADGRTKIEVAREVLDGYLTSRDDSQPLGAIAYGHHRKGDCNDIEVLAPVAPQDGRSLIARLNRIAPKGKTPLGQSLRLAGEQVPRTAEEADIVLVTDGLETCGVDPCAVADELAAEGIEIRAHVVGFGLSAAEVQSLACVADRTGGLLMRPQSGAELAQALALATAEAPPAAMTGVRLIFSYPGAMPDMYEWVLRNASSGEEVLRTTLSGDARYRPLPVELVPGAYVATLTARAGQGEARFVATAEPQDVEVKLIGRLPVARLRQRGPYAAHNETVAIDLNVIEEGQEIRADAMSLLLYPEAGGEQINYFTVEGVSGHVMESINLSGPGRYRLRLETSAGDLIDEMTLDAVLDPAVSITVPPVVEPGQAIPVESSGSQLWYDRIAIRQGETEVDAGVALGELAANRPLMAPAVPGNYEIVYRGIDSRGEFVDKARTPIQVGAVQDDATGAQALRDAMPGRGALQQPDRATMSNASAEGPGYSCPEPNPCRIDDAATGLTFALPSGWQTDGPSTGSTQAGGGASTPPRMILSHPAHPEYLLSLAPERWDAGEGPCREAGTLGRLCMRQSNDLEALAAFEIVRTTLKWRPRQLKPGSGGLDIASSVSESIGQQPPEVQAAMEGLLGAARNAGRQGAMDPQALMGVLANMAGGGAAPAVPETGSQPTGNPLSGMPTGRDTPVPVTRGNEREQAGASLQPRSGMWQARLGSSRAEGCPELMQKMLPRSITSLPQDAMQPRRLTFEQPFHPDQLELSRTLSSAGRQPVVWQPSGQHAWQTQIDPEVFGQLPPGSKGGSRMQWELTIKGTDLIEHTSSVKLSLPQVAAAMIGQSDDCRIVSVNLWERVGD